jgi:hypothetical protein
MPRPKGSKNKVQSGITYPRKCNYCDYVSNNPSMYHYHSKIHQSIPAGTLCNHGCGQLATVINTNGKYTCLSLAQHCPEYIRRHSTRVLEHWQRPEATERKEKTKERFFKFCCGVPAVLKKQKQTLKEKFGNFTPEQMKDFRHYGRRIRARAQKWAKEQGYVLGQQTYHVDHKFSIWDSWQAGLSESIVNHPANLQILEAKKNSSKGFKSSITLEELLKSTNLPN